MISVFTIAMAQERFYRMAINLLRSVALHSPQDYKLFILTDHPDRFRSVEFGRPVSVRKFQPTSLHHLMKLNCLDHLNSGLNIYLDSDSLVYSWAGVPEYVRAHHTGTVTTIGNTQADGEWYGDVADRCSRFGIASIPRFNGGMYLLEKNEGTRRLFTRALELAENYDKLGFGKINGQFNDEVVLSVALAEAGIFPDTWNLDMYGVYASSALEHSDVVLGERRTANGLQPRIFHLCGGGIEKFLYKRDAWLLQNHFGARLNHKLARIFANPLVFAAHQSSRVLGKLQRMRSKRT